MKQRAGSDRQPGCEARIAWLLRANRLYGADEKFAAGVNFVKAFRGKGFRRAIDGAQLTRWERAGQRVGFTALRRYEELLNLPSHTLVAVADVLHRTTSGVAGPSYLDRRIDGDAAEVRKRVEQLIDRARGSDRMTRHAWDELTQLLCHLPTVFLYPSTLWNDLVDRLVAEMIIADGGGDRDSHTTIPYRARERAHHGKSGCGRRVVATCPLAAP
jgi:hypothetical protein